jgi:predicted transcriptional regulator
MSADRGADCSTGQSHDYRAERGGAFRGPVLRVQPESESGHRTGSCSDEESQRSTPFPPCPGVRPAGGEPVPRKCPRCIWCASKRDVEVRLDGQHILIPATQNALKQSAGFRADAEAGSDRQRIEDRVWELLRGRWRGCREEQAAEEEGESSERFPVSHLWSRLTTRDSAAGPSRPAATCVKRHYPETCHAGERNARIAPVCGNPLLGGAVGTMYDIKTSALTIRLDREMERQLARLARRTGRSRSELVREALRRQLALAEFQDLRRRIMPLAEARGYLTDEDVFRDVS